MFLKGDIVVNWRSLRVCVVARDQDHHEWVKIEDLGERNPEQKPEWHTVPIAPRDLVRVESEEEGEQLIQLYRSPRLLLKSLNPEDIDFDDPPMIIQPRPA